MENELEVKNKCLDDYKKKYEKLNEYKTLPKVNEVKVEKLLDDMNSFPGRIQMSGPIGETSVLPDKKDNNPLHGLNGRKMAGKDIFNEGDSNKYKIEELDGDD